VQGRAGQHSTAQRGCGAVGVEPAVVYWVLCVVALGDRKGGSDVCQNA